MVCLKFLTHSCRTFPELFSSYIRICEKLLLTAAQFNGNVFQRLLLNFVVSFPSIAFLNVMSCGCFSMHQSTLSLNPLCQKLDLYEGR